MSSDLTDSHTDRTGPGLSHYIEVVRRRRRIILGLVATAVGIAALLSLLQKPAYEAQEKIVIGQGNTLFQPQNGNVIQPFTATMADLLTSDIVARDVISSLGLTSTPSALLKKVHVSTNPQTAVLQVSVKDGNPDQAQRIASAFGDAFGLLVQERFGQGLRQGQPPITAIVFDPAHVVPGRVAPKPAQNIAIAAALGFVLGLLAAFLTEHFDRRIRTREEFESKFRLPVIGQVPGRPSRPSRGVAAKYGARLELSEAFRAVRAMLNSLGTERNLRTLVVTSATEGQGKEIVTANLARALTGAGASTLLIEGDLRQRRLDSSFGHWSPGLTDVLEGLASFEEAVSTIVTSEDAEPRSPTASGPDTQARRIASPAASKTTSTAARRRRSSTARKVTPRSNQARLDFLSSGQVWLNPADLLSAKRITTLLTDVAESYDHVLIDTAPLLSFADALELAHVADGVLVVAQRDRATEHEAEAVASLLEGLDAYTVGVVVTEAPPRIRPSRSDAGRRYLLALRDQLRALRRRLSNRRAKPVAAERVPLASDDR